jgi:hypothetical protein
VLEAVLFIAIAIAIAIAASFALLGVSQVKMMSPEAIERDGMATGLSAPHWELFDTQGRRVESPPRNAPLQLILFSDHSLKSFPSLIQGLNALIRSEADVVEPVLLLRKPSELAERLLPLLGLDIPVVTGSPVLYAKYNVRVTPFIIVVNSVGLVCASSLVNHDWQIDKLLTLANLANPRDVDLARLDPL